MICALEPFPNRRACYLGQLLLSAIPINVIALCSKTGIGIGISMVKVLRALPMAEASFDLVYSNLH